MSTDLTDFLHWVCAQSLDSSPAVERKARWLLMDTLGCVIAGRLAPPVHRFESLLGKSDAGPFHFLGGPGLSNSGVAWMFSMAACWDEACEGHAGAHGRPGVATFAALLPLSPTLTLGRFLRAFVIGYEMSARTGAKLRIKPGMHVDGNWPALGAAAAVAYALGLDAAGVAQAVHIAACQLPMSLYLPIRSGDTARNTYLGHAAALGQSAAFSAASGICAPKLSIDEYARVGLGSQESAKFDLGHQFHILDAYLKPYAAVRHVHYGALAACQMKSDIDLEQITAISLQIYEEATIYCSNRAPKTPLQAQFSLSFGVAAMLRWGCLDPLIYREPQFHDPLMRRLEQLVDVTLDQGLTQTQTRGATLTITTNAHTFQRQVTAVYGDASMPFTQEALTEKFATYCETTLSQSQATSMANRILTLPETESFNKIWPTLL